MEIFHIRARESNQSIDAWKKFHARFSMVLITKNDLVEFIHYNNTIIKFEALLIFKKRLKNFERGKSYSFK